jgi:hypothetical protein
VIRVEDEYPMQSEVPSQSFIWGVLAPRFQSELTLQKSEIWRLSGLLEEYGGPAEGDFYREREQKALIEVLTGLLVKTVICEVAERQLANSSGRRAGRPRDAMTPFLAPELLSVFLRCHDRAGRQSVATSVDGRIRQREAGQLYEFVKAVIQPLNQYLTTELGRGPLSAARLARFALDDRRRMAAELQRMEAKASAKKAATVIKRQLPPMEIALRRVFAIPE